MKLLTPAELLKSANLIARKRVTRASLVKIIRGEREEGATEVKILKFFKEYPVRIIAVCLILILGLGVAFLAVTQTEAYNDKVQRCEELGGVYIKGDNCIKGERIPL